MGSVSAAHASRLAKSRRAAFVISSQRNVVSDLSQFRKMNKNSRGVNEEEVSLRCFNQVGRGGNIDRKRVHTRFRLVSNLCTTCAAFVVSPDPMRLGYSMVLLWYYSHGSRAMSEADYENALRTSGLEVVRDVTIKDDLKAAAIIFKRFDANKDEHLNLKVLV